MKTVAITGLLGSGKSEVLRFLQKKKYCVLKADELAKSFLLPNSPCFEDLKVLFGKEALTQERGFCSQRLAKEVFSKHPEKLKTLENLLHPLVRKQLSSFVLKKKREGESLVFYEIPLLSSQSLFENRFDCIVLIIRPKAAILKSLVQKGWSKKSSQERLKRQGSEVSLRKRADFVLQNNGSLEDLFYQVEVILKTPLFSGQSLNAKTY